MHKLILGIFLLAGSLPAISQPMTGCGGSTRMNSIRAGHHVVSVGEHLSRLQRKRPDIRHARAWGWQLSGNRIAWAYHNGTHVTGVLMQCPDTGSRRR